MTLFKNTYCPTSLDDYIGDSQTIQYYIERSLEGKESKTMILFGRPGTGKSTIVNILAKHYNMDIVITNASDERNTIDPKIMHTSSLENTNKKLIVFDECDGMTKKGFDQLGIVIKHYSPIILICNDISKIPTHIKSKCYQKQIITDRFSLKNLAKKIIKSEDLKISNDQLNEALIHISSYRSLLDYLQFGTVSSKGSFEIKENFKDEITFISDNSEQPKLISLADIYYQRSQKGYKNGIKIAKYILSSIDKTSSEYPRTYKLLHEVKNKKSGKIKIIGFGD